MIEIKDFDTADQEEINKWLEANGKVKNPYGNYTNLDVKAAVEKLQLKTKKEKEAEVKQAEKAEKKATARKNFEEQAKQKATEYKGVQQKNADAPKTEQKAETTEETPKTPVEEVTEQKTEKAEEKKPEEQKAPEEKPVEKTEEPKEEEKTSDPSDEVKPADESTTEKIASGKGTVAEYLASEHPSTIGYIANRIKNGDIGEAIRVSLKAAGSVVGGALMANGMSLLGDNSYFAKIGSGTSLQNMTTEEQQKVANAIVEVQSAQAQDTIANKKIVDKWLPNLDEEKKALISGSGFAIATLDNEKLSTLLTQKGFTADEIKDVINVKPMLKYSSAQAIDNVAKIAGTKTAETTEKKTAYEFKVEQFDKLTEIDKLIAELETKKAQVTIENKKQLANLASTIAAFYGTASNAESQSAGKNFGWNVNGSAGINAIKIVNASINGGVQSATSNTENSSTSVSGYTEEGRQQAQTVIDKMEKETLAKTVKNIQLAYDDAIKGLNQRREILAKTTEANDAVIPNGAIESVNLTDGTTLEVNPADGAVLTTNPVTDSLLCFAEGEVNPFEWLGYEGEKKQFEYYEHLFDDTPKKITTFDEALEFLR